MSDLLFYFTMLYACVLAGIGFALTVYEFRHNIVKTSPHKERNYQRTLAKHDTVVLE